MNLIHNKPFNRLLQMYPVVEELNSIMKKWIIPPQLVEMYLDKRDDILDFEIEIGKVVFHIPKLENENLFVLWNCLWPECNNCCKVDRLPLTKDDIERLTAKLSYDSKSKFLEFETNVDTWTHKEVFDDIPTTRTQVCLKHANTDSEERKIVQCRFAGSQGCAIHSEKPGVCRMYPFMTYIENHGKIFKIHAMFQFTGECPGFYLSSSINDFIPSLKKYGDMIQKYNIEYLNTIREGYAMTSRHKRIHLD